MQITVNGILENTFSTTISDYLFSKGFKRDSFTGLIIEHNFAIVKTDKWDTLLLNDGDNIEILKLTGGG